MNRVLILEPYYGGSHKLFLTGLQKTVDADYTLLTLPPRKWKMRMQLSAFWFVQDIKKIAFEKRCFDTILCSTFVDVAVLRSLLTGIPGWNPNARVLTYFHENQFEYPGQEMAPDIRQFAAINLSTAMASDSCAFNSQYNLESFLTAIGKFLKKAADMKPLEIVEGIRGKSVVLYPGMDYSSIDEAAARPKGLEAGPPVLVWNHRWEHDKGPELFFEALYEIKKEGVAFQVIVMGESFANVPQCFVEALSLLEDETIHFGYADNREQYAALLRQGDVIVSAARHEFFGISVLEGIRAGCYPLLPHALSYPELYPDDFLYQPGTLKTRLAAVLKNTPVLQEKTRRNLTGRFDWKQCAGRYRRWLFSDC